MGCVTAGVLRRFRGGRTLSAGHSVDSHGIQKRCSRRARVAAIMKLEMCRISIH